MTKQEAIQAMREGNKVTHRYFTDNEWMMLTPSGAYRFEDGNVCPSLEFWAYRDSTDWNDGWSIYKPNSEQNAQASVATDDDSSTKAG